MPQSDRRNVAVLGATGSIGKATLDVLSRLGAPYRVWGMSAHQQLDLAVQQAIAHRPTRLCFSGLSRIELDNWSQSLTNVPTGTQIESGPEALIQMAEHPEVDIVVAGIVGSAGLISSLAAAKAGKRLALANKESLVVAGSLMMEAVQKHGAVLLPVDSEHSAVFQALETGQKTSDQIQRIVLTASGGSLRDLPIEKLSEATVDQVLQHPTWSMGRKITVDSATMMNKSLEIIEARWLFNIPPEKIAVVIHPQSIIHSMVEFVDGSVLAQLSPPDMRLPIQYALTYPERVAGPARQMDWSQAIRLDWKAADLERYPALELGYEVAGRGGTTGAVLNAANEAAVQLFLDGKIRFTEIVVICRKILEQHHFDPSPTLDHLLKIDRWARQEVEHWFQTTYKNFD
jgi:1-deoxy-D-xylulose-5-phosphate reductoisomerase